MKIYLLGVEDYDGTNVLGIYSSKEKAMESFPFQPTKLDESDIREMEIDPPHGQEMYEDFYYYCACTDGDEWDGECLSRMLPSEVKIHFSWDGMRNRGTALAYAKTPQEAKEKAIEAVKRIEVPVT